MKTIASVIEAVRERPAMYIGKRSPIRLQLFLQGWLVGRTPSDADLLQRFGAWVADKYDIRSSHSWSEIITFFSEDEVEAFQKFLDLFDEFRADDP
jgi:hypothetical protein